MGAALALSCLAVYMLRRWAVERQERTGKIFPVWTASASLVLGLPLLAWFAFGAPTDLDLPRLVGFNFQGGLSVSPEFAALLLGLVLYTSAFVAEIVRAGIQAISRGQTEAALSVGLRPGLVLTLIVLPQALRVIIPPLTSHSSTSPRTAPLRWPSATRTWFRRQHDHQPDGPGHRRVL